METKPSDMNKLALFLTVTLFPPLLDAGDLRFGFATHFKQGWNVNLIPLIAATGVGYIRDDLSAGGANGWEPTVGTFQISPTDQPYLVAAHANNLKVVGILNPDTLYPSGDPYDPAKMAARAVYIAQSGLVDAIEVTNEPNNAYAATEGASWKTMLATLTTTVRNAVHAAVPSVPVIGLGAQGSQIIGLIPSTTVDGIVYHPYDTGNAQPANNKPDTAYEQPEGVNATSSLLYVPWIAILRAATNLPLWETEWGVGTINGFTQDEQSDYLVRRLLTAAGLKVEHTFIYEFKDNTPTDLFGVYDQAGTTAKTSYAIVTRTISALAGVLGDPTSGVAISSIANGNGTDAVAYAYQGSTKTVVAYWFANHSPSAPPAASTLSLTFSAPHPHANSILFDPFTGNSVSLNSLKTCVSSGTNFTVDGLPVSDHPMLLIMQ